MPRHPEADWLDYPRAAEYLHKRIPGGFTVRALQRAKWGEKIPAARIQGRIWFKKTDLDKYVREITTT